MFLLYNILQLIFIPVFSPLLLVAALLIPRYRGRVISRLGFGLRNNLSNQPVAEKSIWIHALSVGEVTSAIPLIHGLRKIHPSARIVLTVSTQSGEVIAKKLLTNLVDHIVPSPLDFLPVTALFYDRIQPHLFILVETDFWPNLLLYLQYKRVPAVLVNGRVSGKSLTGYKRFGFFFRPMFRSFNYLCMQTKLDVKNMISMGIDKEKAHVLGNLKFDAQADKLHQDPSSISSLLPENRLIITAGSTHQGEEDILFEVVKELHTDYPALLLILAPRNPDRAWEISELARQYDLSTVLRSQNRLATSDILIIDTIGELVSFYAYSDIAFLGGSLVSKGGHNPIEPAILGKPVLFGPYMEDFQEIAGSLIKEGGGERVDNVETLKLALDHLLSSKEQRHRRGTAAKGCILKQRGVVEKHLKLFQTLM